MICYGDAKKILGKYVKNSKVIIHSQGVSDFALKLARKIDRNHPELKIDKEKVRIAALLHDIGKEYQEGHEDRSLDILRREGLGELSRISVHGFLYSKQSDKEWSNITEKIENKIVAYSDLRFKYSLVTVRERLEGAKIGWTGSPEEIKSKTEYIFSIMLELEKEIFELAGEEV